MWLQTFIHRGWSGHGEGRRTDAPLGVLQGFVGVLVLVGPALLTPRAHALILTVHAHASAHPPRGLVAGRVEAALLRVPVAVASWEGQAAKGAISVVILSIKPSTMHLFLRINYRTFLKNETHSMFLYESCYWIYKPTAGTSQTVTMVWEWFNLNGSFQPQL